MAAGSLDITPIRRLGNLFLLTAFNTVYDAHLTDLCYGFCAFHRRYLEHLQLSATGFEIEAEMTVRAMQAGLRIAEVPSLELPRRTGASNLHAIRDGIRVLRTVLRHQPLGCFRARLPGAATGCRTTDRHDGGGDNVLSFARPAAPMQPLARPPRLCPVSTIAHR